MIKNLDIFIASSVLLLWIPFLLLEDSFNLNPQQAVLVITFGQLVLLIPVLYFLYSKKIHFSDLGLKKFKFEGCLITLGLWILVFIINAVYSLILQNFGLETQFDLTPIFKLLDPFYAIMFIIGGGIIAPIVEEVYFRGLLLTLFQKKYNTKIAIIASTLLFSLAHLQPNAFIPILLLGFVFAIVFVKTKSILPAIIIHAINNLLALISVYILSLYTN